MPDFLIIGGGVAGPIAALRLVEDGHKCTIFERASKPHTIGGAVNLAPNGMRLFNSLGLRSEIEEKGCFVESFEMKEEKGGVIGYLSNSSKDGFVSVRIMRPALQQIFLEACRKKGVEVYFDKALESVEEDEGVVGKVTARFTDGTTAVGDYLIGADGIRSKVREYVMDGKIKPVYTGTSIVYGILPTADLPHVDFTTMHASIAIVTRRGLFATAFTNNEHSQLYWLSYRSIPAEKVDAVETREQELERYRDVYSPVPEIITATTTFFAWDIYELPNLPRWSKGQVVLIGDAAHAFPPNQGQGVSQAIEDVSVLARVISKGVDLSRYYEIRNPRVVKLKQAFAPQSNNEERGPLGQRLRVLIFWLFLLVLKVFSWVSPWDQFSYDVEKIKI